MGHEVAREVERVVSVRSELQSCLVQSRAVSCSLVQSRAVSCSLVQSRAVSCSLVQSRAVSCSLVQSRPEPRLPQPLQRVASFQRKVERDDMRETGVPRRIGRVGELREVHRAIAEAEPERR